METSDSEYFESADEDPQSDDEDTKTIIKSVKTEQVEINRSKIEDLKLSETEIVPNSTTTNNNANIDSAKTENQPKDEENNVCDNKKCVTSEKPAIKPEENNEAQNKVAVEKVTVPETTSLEEKEENMWDEDEIDWQTNKSHEKSITEKIAVCEMHKKDDEKTNKEENMWDEEEINWGKEQEENNETNMWDNDDWEPVEDSKPPREKTQKIESTQAEEKSWGSWGTWGVSSIITTATQSVSSLTHGISTVLETGMGVPDPEELARINKAEKEKLQTVEETTNDDSKNHFGLSNLVMGMSHLTKLVETTGTKVIAGGLDTLETIGKKTMEVLQEGDPGLKKKRAFLKIDQDKPVLSQLLREAKEKAEEENKFLEEKHFAKRAKNYETLFDDHQGLVHLEALEMLSKQCDIKLQTILESYTDETLTDVQETMDQVKELCELPDEDEDEQASFAEIKDKLESAVNEINVPISYKKLIETWDETEAWLNTLKLEICDERELHQQAIETLAQLTAIAVEQFHKTGELLLVKEHRSTADEADSLVQLTTTLTSLIGIVAAKFSDKLNAKSSSSKNKEEVNSLITNVFFEAANSSSYIQDAFQLLIPVLQVGAI